MWKNEESALLFVAGCFSGKFKSSIFKFYFVTFFCETVLNIFEQAHINILTAFLGTKKIAKAWDDWRK